MAMDSSKYSIIPLVSGGMDSLVMLHRIIKEGHRIPFAIAYEYGQRHVKELQYARKGCNRFGVKLSVLQLPPIPGSMLTDGGGVSYEVPYRNALFILTAAAYAKRAKATRIAIGINKQDAADYPDCCIGFLAQLNNMMAFCGDIVATAPLIQMTKADIRKEAERLGIESWSCYRGGAEPCGECIACRL